MEYLVSWVTCVYADSPEAAIEQAQEDLIRDGTTATVWGVRAEEAGAEEVDHDLLGESTPITRLLLAIHDVLDVRDRERNDDASTEDLLDAIAGLEGFVNREKDD